MEVICFGLGMIIGAIIIYFVLRKNISKKEQVLDGEIMSYHRATTQITNFLNYNGTSAGQEDVD